MSKVLTTVREDWAVAYVITRNFQFMLTRYSKIFYLQVMILKDISVVILW